MPGRPLEGIRVSDFTWAWAGPYATALLAWMGAEVIKVESMRRLDHARRQRLYGGGFSGTVNQAGPFNDLNLNKLSIRLDLTQPKAVALAKALVQVSDVVAENYRPGVMANLGLDYAALKEVKRNIIMLSSSACGQGGPERRYVGYAPTFPALGGITHV